MDLFPVVIATGSAFCNRSHERTLLKQYILNGRHAVIMAPRRYGKTSLIHQTLLELDLPYTIMELTLAATQQDVELIITKHVSHLLYSLLPKTTKAKQALLNLFKWLNPELVLTAGGQKLTLHPDKSTLNTIENIAEILKKLDEAAALVNKRVVVVMDEFQQLSEFEDYVLEAAIRNAMQYSQHVSYVFSGSNRHMLLNMFNDKKRPFYNSCEIMKLERISEDDYELFIQKAAHHQWGKGLPSAVLQKIFELTERHSSYVNRICGYFWLINQFPSIDNVVIYWKQFITSKHAEFTEELLHLSKNQKKILAYLAHKPTAHPCHSDVCCEIKLAEASIRQAIQVLMLKDYLYKDNSGVIRLLDPAFKDFVNHF